MCSSGPLQGVIPTKNISVTFIDQMIHHLNSWNQVFIIQQYRGAIRINILAMFYIAEPYKIEL